MNEPLNELISGHDDKQLRSLNYWACLCLDMIVSSIDFEWGNIESMRWFNELSPHAFVVAEYSFSESYTALISHDSLVILYNTLGYGFRYCSQYEKRLSCYKKALSLQEDELSAYSSRRSTLYYNIAWLHDEMGNINAALGWYLRDLHIAEAVHGIEGLSTAHTYNSIGTIYHKKQNLKKAMDYYKRALYVFETVLDKSDHDVASVCNNIANIYDEMNKFDQALYWHKRDLDICEKFLGKNHPDTATSYNNIGHSHFMAGKIGYAIEYFAKAISIRYSIFGKDHPITEQTIRSARLAYSAREDPASSFDEWLCATISEQDIDENRSLSLD